MLQQQRVAGGEFLHTLQDGAVIGHIAPGHEILDCARIDFAAHQRVRQQTLQF